MARRSAALPPAAGLRLSRGCPPFGLAPAAAVAVRPGRCPTLLPGWQAQPRGLSVQRPSPHTRGCAPSSLCCPATATWSRGSPPRAACGCGASSLAMEASPSPPSPRPPPTPPSRPRRRRNSTRCAVPTRLPTALSSCRCFGAWQSCSWRPALSSTGQRPRGTLPAHKTLRTNASRCLRTPGGGHAPRSLWTPVSGASWFPCSLVSWLAFLLSTAAPRGWRPPPAACLLPWRGWAMEQAPARWAAFLGPF
mmetsp:Transcript_2982/g.8405  ORF Transcript_2982/g.8405 Transcript_2982/m.8405 type:complete len:250 (+) Transcript_2982:2314-3063(+)